jgi:hypothetical protein
MDQYVFWPPESGSMIYLSDPNQTPDPDPSINKQKNEEKP